MTYNKMKNYLKKIITEDGCGAILHNGKVIKSSLDSNYKCAIFLDNDITYKDSKRSFLQCDCNSFENNQLSVSMWIAPVKTSEENAPIVTNETSNGFTGLFLNANGEENKIGAKWNEQQNSSVIDLGVELKKDKWTHLVVNFNKNGIFEIFINGIFENKIDTKIQNEIVEFKNIKLGGFCGYIDDFNLYSKVLEYGNVKLKSRATHNIAYLFYTSRITGDVASPNILNDDTNFYYIQSDEYIEAYKNYKTHLENDHEYYEDSSKYPTDGGINDGRMKVANGSFRTFTGKIVSEPL